MNKKSHPYRFTGKEWDEETELYYMSARYQDPMTSRWISADPAGPELLNPMGEDGNLRSGFSVVESVNWYSYTSNNPLKYKDPSGMIQDEDYFNKSNSQKQTETPEQNSPYLYSSEASFSLTPGGVDVSDGNAINPNLQGEAHYNNYSVGASIEGSTGGAQVEGSWKDLSGKASLEAVTGVAAIGLTDGRPNVEVFGAMLEGEVSGQLNLPGNTYAKLGASGSLLSGGLRLDFSQGIDIKIGLGAFGAGVSITFGKSDVGGIGSLDVTPKRRHRR